VIAEDVAEGAMEKVRGGVVCHRRETGSPGDHRTDAIACREAVALEEEDLILAEAKCAHQPGPPLPRAVELDPSLVGDLAAAFGVEGRLPKLREERPIGKLLQGPQLRQDVDLLVADEVRPESRGAGELRRALDQRGAVVVRGTGPRSLLAHEPVELVLVDRQAPLLGQLACHLEGEAVRVVETEGICARDRPRGSDLLEEPHAVCERLCEPLLLRGQNALDLTPVLDELRVDVSHSLDDDSREASEEGRVEPDPAAVLDRPANDPPQHVAATFVRRSDAVRDEERHGAAVVGEHAVSLRRDLGLPVPRPGLARDPAHDRLEAIRLVHGVDALEERRAALDPEPGIDVL
jgi:hypothetical protein